MLPRALLLAVLLAAALAAPEPARPPPPARPAQEAEAHDGKLPDDILCSVGVGGERCKDTPQPAPAVPKRPKRQEPDAEGTAPAEVDPSEVCRIFGGPSCPSEGANAVLTPCSCPSGASDGCECVPYYQCDKTTGSFNTDGVDVIDIRQKQDRPDYDPSAANSTCGHYLQQCCRVRPGTGGQGQGPVTEEPWREPDPVPQPQPPVTPRPDQPQPLIKAKCGVRYEHGIGNRIQGAVHDEAQFGEITWMVAIFKKRQSEQDYLCGGGLIAPNVVLTAAHCVDEKSSGSLKIRAGEWDSRTTLEAYRHQDRDVADVIVHPDFKPNALHNDVALLVLREPVQLGYHIGTICLPEQNENFDHRTCLVSGWGKSEFGKEGVYQNILRRLDDLPAVPHGQCQEKLRRTRVGPYFRLNKSFMCAGGIKGRDACTGDGGSPLACPISDSADSRYKFVGIVSWGVGCGAEDVPGVYADVAQFRNWIDRELSDRGVGLIDADN